MKRAYKGSYTVEAALLVPVLLFVMALGMKIGLILYREITQEDETQMTAELWEVEDFYKNHWIEEVLEND